MTDVDTWINPFLAELRRITHDDLLRGIYDHVVGDQLGLDHRESEEVGRRLVTYELAQYEPGTRTLLLTPAGVERAAQG